jgi:predicted nucleotidyltransferase
MAAYAGGVEVEQVLAALAGAEVRFVVVGGVAVVLHGHPRLTADLDLVIDLEVGPAGRAMQVLTELGLVPRLPVPASAFADPATRDRWVAERNLMVFTLTEPGGMLEVDLFAQSPLPFEALWSQAVTVPVGKTEVRIAALDDLIAMKRKSGRPQDLADITALEARRDR